MTSSSPSDMSFAGSWKFYFHDPSNPNWGEKDYILIATVSSWLQFWIVMNAISDAQFEQGGFFFMKDGFPPRYEHYTNRKGGAYQLQVSQTDEYRKIFTIYCISMILETCVKDPKNKIVGVTISLKRGFYILKLWNVEAAAYNQIEDIHNYVKPTTSILYEYNNRRDC